MYNIKYNFIKIQYSFYFFNNKLGLFINLEKISKLHIQIKKLDYGNFKK